MVDIIVKSVVLASDFRDFILSNLTTIISDSHKKLVLDSNDDDILRITKNIGSLKIVDVTKVTDDDLIADILRTK